MTATPALRPKDAPALRPKDAATLLVIRRDGASPRVLMGRRVGGHAFMPGKWVFPGGRIHRSDFGVPVARELGDETHAALARTCAAHRGRALALAAVRETFEETGLILGRRGEGRVSPQSDWRDLKRRNFLRAHLHQLSLNLLKPPVMFNLRALIP